MSVKTKLCARCQKTRRKKNSSYCVPCKRKKGQLEREAKPDRDLEAKARYRKTEQNKLAQKRYRESAKGRAAKKRQDTKRAKSDQRYREKKKMELEYEERKLSASLPVAVVKPFVERMLKEFAVPQDSPFRRLTVPGDPTKPMTVHNEGISYMAKAIGITDRTIRNIVDETEPVSIRTADRLATYADFSLGELFQRAEEWALLTGDSWPEGYMRPPKGAPRPTRGVMSSSRKHVFELLAEHEELTQGQLAEILDLEISSAAAHLRAMQREKYVSVRQFKNQERRSARKYRLNDRGKAVADTLVSEVAA